MVLHRRIKRPWWWHIFFFGYSRNYLFNSYSHPFLCDWTDEYIEDYFYCIDPIEQDRLSLYYKIISIVEQL